MEILEHKYYKVGIKKEIEIKGKYKDIIELIEAEEYQLNE